MSDCNIPKQSKVCTKETAELQSRECVAQIFRLPADRAEHGPKSLGTAMIPGKFSEVCFLVGLRMHDDTWDAIACHENPGYLAFFF